MKGSRSVNAELNQVLGLELIAINQYFLHAKMLMNWGFHVLGKHEYKASIEAMKSADDLCERILFLEGLPNLQDLGKLQIGQDVSQLLTSDLNHENQRRAGLVAAVAHCEKEKDFISRELVAKILEEVEERIDFLETQFDLINQTGLQNYLQSAAGSITE